MWNSNWRRFEMTSNESMYCMKNYHIYNSCFHEEEVHSYKFFKNSSILQLKIAVWRADLGAGFFLIMKLRYFLSHLLSLVKLPVRRMWSAMPCFMKMDSASLHTLKLQLSHPTMAILCTSTKSVTIHMVSFHYFLKVYS